MSSGSAVKGILNVSGEMIPYAPIKVEILPSLLNVIVPGWMDTKRWEDTFNQSYGAKLSSMIHSN